MPPSLPGLLLCFWPAKVLTPLSLSRSLLPYLLPRSPNPNNVNKISTHFRSLSHTVGLRDHETVSVFGFFLFSIGCVNVTGENIDTLSLPALLHSWGFGIMKQFLFPGF